jgi:uncharacterized Zn finger protein
VELSKAHVILIKGYVTFQVTVGRECRRCSRNNDPAHAVLRENVSRDMLEHLDDGAVERIHLVQPAQREHRIFVAGRGHSPLHSHDIAQARLTERSV